MITKEIYNLLKQDERLKGIKINPFSTNVFEKAIVYKVIPQSSNKIIEQSRLEITVIDTDYSRAEELLEIVKDILITFGDNQLNNNILSVVQNGGGSMKNEATGTYHLSAFFNVKNIY